jgi:hypothetical protein
MLITRGKSRLVVVRSVSEYGGDTRPQNLVQVQFEIRCPYGLKEGGYEIGVKQRPIESSYKEKAALAAERAERGTSEPASQFGMSASDAGRKG